MKYSSKEKKIIEMCSSYENRRNPDENNKAYNIKLWSDKVKYERYNGSDGLKKLLMHTVINLMKILLMMIALTTRSTMINT
jgi:hypothetical protein